MMPSGGTQTRGNQIATLTRIARDMLASDDTLRLRRERRSEEAARLAADADEREARAPDPPCRRHAPPHPGRADRAPRRRARQRQRCLDRGAGERTISRSSSPCSKRPSATRANMPMRSAGASIPTTRCSASTSRARRSRACRTLFGALKDGIDADPRRSPASVRADAHAILRRRYPAEKQREVALALRRRAFGYDFDRGRLDTTVHPFEISFTRNDVRITTRYNENYLRPALFGAFHETGHGLYEQNVDPAFTRTVFATDLVGLYARRRHQLRRARIAVAAVGEPCRPQPRVLGSCTSPNCRAPSRTSLGDVTPERFYAAVTSGRARPDPDRGRRAHLRPPHHAARRDRGGADGRRDSPSTDVPDAWDAAMKRGLGLDVPERPRGRAAGHPLVVGHDRIVLHLHDRQRHGRAALRDRAHEGRGIAQGLERGDYAPLANWLRENVWRHGRRWGREEILHRTTGRGLEPGPYLRYLRAKYAA